MRGGARSPPHTRIHGPESSIKHVLQLRHREVIHPHLPYLWDNDETLARDRQRVGPFYVTSKNQNELVTGVNHVARIDGSGLVRIELGSSLAEEIQAENYEPAIDVGLALSQAANDRVFLGKASGPHRSLRSLEARSVGSRIDGAVRECIRDDCRLRIDTAAQHGDVR